MLGMFYAPQLSLSGSLVTIPDGLPGIEATIVQMRAMVEQFKKDLAIRNLAVSLIFFSPQKDEYSEACALFNFVRDNVRYVRDIVGVETLFTPPTVAQTLVGDCDDQSTLLACLLESVGYPTRFVIAAYQQENTPEHVYLQVLINGEFVNCDPTEFEAFGYAPPDPVTIWYEQR